MVSPERLGSLLDARQKLLRHRPGHHAVTVPAGVGLGTEGARGPCQLQPFLDSRCVQVLFLNSFSD